MGDFVFFGRTLSAETKAKMSKANYGRAHSAEAKMSLVNLGKNNPRGMLDCTHSTEILAKMSDAKTGEKNPQGMLGRTHSTDTLMKMSIAKLGNNNSISKRVFVYYSTTPTILFHEFVSYSEAAKHFNCSIMIIFKYLKSGKLFQKQWIFSLSKK